MLIEVLKAKIHNATVTRKELNYEGSIGIDAAMLAASGNLFSKGGKEDES